VPLRTPILVLLAALVLGLFLTWDLISSAVRDRGAPGGDRPPAEPPALITAGARVFDAQCSPCHGPRADWPIAARLKSRTRDELYALLDHLPLVNPAMPGFQGTDAERRALAAYLASLEAWNPL
jgi:mono/diheme cytochrome c family protein